MGRKEVQMKSLSDLSPPVYFLTYAMILGEIDWTLVFIVIGKKKGTNTFLTSVSVELSSTFFKSKSKGP